MDYALVGVESLTDIGDYGDVCLILIKYTIISSMHCCIFTFAVSVCCFCSL